MLAALTAAAVGASATLACRPPAMGPVGYSPVRAADHDESSGAADAGDAASPVPADFRDHMTALSPRQPSQGHALRFDAIVWGDDAARDAWNAHAAMPDGAVLVEEGIESGRGGDRPAGLLRMEKKDGQWSFLAIGDDGRVATDARCARCHAEAPQDGVFRSDAVSRAASPPGAQPSTTATTDATTARVPTAVATTAATADARSAGPADASVKP